MIKIAATLLTALILGGCWPASETYFSSSAPGGRQTYVCGRPGYQLQFHSAHIAWARLSFHPILLPSGGMYFNFSVDDDDSIISRHADRAAAQDPDPSQRRWARMAFFATESVGQKGAKLSGIVTVTWPPNNRTDIPIDEDNSYLVPEFSGDTAVVTMPTLTIDGKSETFPPVTVQRRTGVTVGGVNGC